MSEKMVKNSGSNPEIVSRSVDVYRDGDPLEALAALAKMNVILLGIPGAGKTALAQELRARNENIEYISLGAISRALPKDSPERQELDRLFTIGSPVGVPEFFCTLVEPYIDAAIAKGSGFILDGIPKKDEEIQPLLDFLARKNAGVDLVISCELPTLTAYDRVVNRSEREGDPDTMEVFTNRTARYVQDLDGFKQRLTDNSDTPLIVINTAESSIEESANQVVDGVQRILNQQYENEHSEEILKEKLYEAVRQKEQGVIIKLIGSNFDDTLPDFPHEMLCREGISEEEACVLVQDALAEQDPDLRDTPYFLSRLARNYVNTTFASLEHLAASLIEEAEVRFGPDYTDENVYEILTQQRGLKTIIELLQNEVVGTKNLSELISEEMSVNEGELTYLTDKMAERAREMGLDPADVSIHNLMTLQPRLWHLLTSNQILFSPDFNYRQASNGLPDSHHSLLPFTKNRRALTATSMGEYVPFIEAVSASEYKYGSTFGFVHFMGMDDTGEAYGAEYPIMMHDKRLLELESETVNDVLRSIDTFYGNHDLWHNMLPVYADHFILHHAHAPLSYGGRLPNYVAFGKELRREKEEYEIGVAMSHARTQQERFEAEPEYYREQTSLILNALDKIPSLRQELKDKCSPDEIEDIIDYLAATAAKEAFNVLRADDPVYAAIEERLETIGVPRLTVTAKDIAALLFKQGLLVRSAIRENLGVDFSDDDILKLLKNDSQLAKASLWYVSLDQSEKESGAEHIVAMLESQGILEVAREAGEAELSGMSKIRWLAMVAPQREQLKGHMEKVHGKPGYIFGDKVIADARDLVLLQYEAIKKDAAHYSYREYARSQNQRLSYRIYSLLFEDGQKLLENERKTMSMLRQGDDTALRISTKEIIAHLDHLMDTLVSCTYDIEQGTFELLSSYAQMLDHMNTLQSASIAHALRAIVQDYQELQGNEARYQAQLNTTYPEAAKHLLDEQMTII